MHNRLLYIFLLSFFCLCSYAAGNKAEADSLLRDSLNKEAMSPDFIHAYIEIASPGDKVYSCYGHTAIRLQCPSKKLDYCFTFEMDMEQTGAWDFISHNGKAGFAAAPTEMFLSQYRTEGRGVKQYELNLMPKEKQTLWRLLDEQVAQGANWTFDYYKVNCTSMILWVISNALDSCSIDFPRLPECMQGTYHDDVTYMAEQSPWYGLVWHGIIMFDGGQHGDATEMMAPRMLAESLPYARIINKEGKSRPLLKGKAQVLCPLTYKDEPCWFTPWMALTVLVILVALIAYVIRRKTKIKQLK